MTYLEYVDYLINEFSQKKADTFEMYDGLLRSKGYLDRYETDIYLGRVNDCHALADQAELVMRGILNGSICPFDPID
jgi:hypothetical protein